MWLLRTCPLWALPSTAVGTVLERAGVQDVCVCAGVQAAGGEACRTRPHTHTRSKSVLRSRARTKGARVDESMQVGGCTSWLAGPMDQPMNARRSSWDCTGIGASQRTCSPCRQDTHPGGDFEGRGEREASWRETGSTRTWDLRRLCVLVGGVCMEGGKSSTPGQSHQQCPARTRVPGTRTSLLAVHSECVNVEQVTAPTPAGHSTSATERTSNALKLHGNGAGTRRPSPRSGRCAKADMTPCFFAAAPCQWLPRHTGACVAGGCKKLCLARLCGLCTAERPSTQGAAVLLAG